MAQIIRNILNHIFGFHAKCNPYFCKVARGEPDNDEVARMEFEIISQDEIWPKVQAILEDLADRADQLKNNATSNRTEAVFTSVAMFVGGKRIYLSGRGEYQRRAIAAFIQYNEGYSWQALIFERFLDNPPPATFSAFLTSRDKKRNDTLANAPDRSKRFQDKKKGNYGYMPEHERELEEIVTDAQKAEVESKYQVTIFERIFGFTLLLILLC